MIQHSEQSLDASVVKRDVTYMEANRNNSAQEGRLPFTQIWHHLIRTKSLPEGLDLDTFFVAIRVRLRNPEWEVRQHALRVLRDLIPMLKISDTETKMELLLEDLIINLGHMGPAVRKAAVDCLRTYFKHTNKYDSILKAFIQKCVANSQINNIQANVVQGIILAVPFLVLREISQDTLVYIIRQLLDKSKQMSHQEQAVLSLVRIKYIIGEEQFEKLIKTSESAETYANFEKLCEMYDLNAKYKEEISNNKETKKLRNDFNQNVLENVDTSGNSNEVIEDKVILETEIQLNSGSAITMQIHEESRQNSFNEVTDSEEDARNDAGIVKVLTDDSEQDEYEMLRRTPRRVRFGGEVVKMRTPDSDSNEAARNKEKIHEEKAENQTARSFIPVAVASNEKSNSEPNSPRRENKKSKTKVVYRSSPNLQHVFGPKVNTSRIPRRNDSFKSTIKITINETSTNDNSPQNKHINEAKKSEKSITTNQKQTQSNKTSSKLANSDSLACETKTKYLPKPVHNQIEVLHNLTRSPERRNSEKDEPNKKETREEAVNPTASSDVKPKQTDAIKKNENPHTQNNNSQATYNSFWVCGSELEDSHADMNALPSISSQSGGVKSGYDRQMHPVGLIDENIIADIYSKDNVKNRFRGLEKLLNIIKNNKDAMESSIEPQLANLMPVLMSAYLQSLSKQTAQEILSYIFLNAKVSVLLSKIRQIATHLSNMKSPDGIRLAMILLKRIPPSQFLDKLLSPSILQAKSSKTREGCLQLLIMISRTFPSTEVNVCKATKCVTELLRDRKRRVRQAALEALATLAQVASSGFVLDVVTKVATDYREKDQILRAVRSRLSRRQLPTVEANGHIRYSTPIGEYELEWLSQGSASISPHSLGTLQRVQSSNARIDPSSEDTNLYRGRDESVNNWQRNQRQNTSISGDRDSSKESTDSKEDASNGQISTQIWAIDPSTFSTSKQVNAPNGVLRPVFVLQPELPSVSSFNNNYFPRNHHKQFNYHQTKGRGRSFSPPKKKFEDSFDESKYVSNSNKDRYYGKLQKDSFKKSFSSDNISSDSRVSVHPASLSSGCSSTSTGSSNRSSHWMSKEFKSGIPIPVSSESRIRFKTRHNTEFSKGPLSANGFYRSKTTSPNTSEKLPVPSKAILAAESLSSGSESSGYFTPPAEHHLPTDDYRHNSNNERPPSQRFIQLESPKPELPSFKMLENESFQQSSFDFQQTIDGSPEPVVEEVEEENASFVVSTSPSDEDIKRRATPDSLDEVDFTQKRPFTEDRVLSKSEIDLQRSSRHQTPRKNPKSAPPLNETLPVYHTFNETTINITNTSLPGSVDVVVQSEVKTVEVPPQQSSSTEEKHTLKRTLSRTSSKRCSNRVQQRQNETVQFPDDLQPFAKAREGLSETLAQLESSEWEITMKGLRGLVRLKRHHPDALEAQLHNVCVALGKHIKNLRSQVARAACTAAAEMFVDHRKSLEMEIEELAAPLLQRTADTNKFLRSDANAALDVMCVEIPPPKVVAVVQSRGCSHQNALVRATAARLLCNLVHRLGPDKIFQLPKETRDKILLSGANMLMDGNLDARKNAKMMLSKLCGHAHFHRAMLEVVPTCTMRHIQKTLKSLI